MMGGWAIARAPLAGALLACALSCGRLGYDAVGAGAADGSSNAADSDGGETLRATWWKAGTKAPPWGRAERPAGSNGARA